MEIVALRYKLSNILDNGLSCEQLNTFIQLVIEWNIKEQKRIKQNRIEQNRIEKNRIEKGGKGQNRNK